MSCTKAQGYLESQAVVVERQTNAGKERKGRQEALALARAATTVIIARGKKMVTFDMQLSPPDDDTLAAHLLGPTGNLRAPTLRRGNTLLVGFSEAAYRSFFALE
jgi:hypothetical protein